MNEPRVFRHSPVQLILLLLIFSAIIVGMLLSLSDGDYRFAMPFVGVFGIILLTSLYSLTQKTIISDTEISTQSLFGSRTLAWNEISRVSGRGYGIKLHSIYENITVAPSIQLPGFEEIVDWIGIKRLDLFDPKEYPQMKRSWTIFTPFLVFGLVIVAMLIVFGTLFNQSPDGLGVLLIPLIFMLIPIFIISGVILSSPQSITIDGKSLLIEFVFSKQTVSADEISSIELRSQRSRNGTTYFIAINLKGNKRIKTSFPLNHSLPITYLTLKNWHQKSLGAS